MPAACVGPSGFTVREIIKATDADIKSWTDSGRDSSARPTRTFIIEVRCNTRLHVIHIS